MPAISAGPFANGGCHNALTIGKRCRVPRPVGPSRDRWRPNPFRYPSRSPPRSRAAPLPSCECGARLTERACRCGRMGWRIRKSPDARVQEGCVAAGSVNIYVHSVTSAEFKRWLERQGATFDLAKGGHLCVFLRGRRAILPIRGSRREMKRGTPGLRRGRLLQPSRNSLIWSVV